MENNVTKTIKEQTKKIFLLPIYTTLINQEQRKVIKQLKQLFKTKPSRKKIFN